jgi:DNA-binding NarL/FixJ family response regulator
MALETVPVIPSARPRIRVAVVDDNPGFRETLASLLGTEELVVVGAAESGTEAIDLVRNTEPDVVLMDVRMPVMNGIEATRLLKSTFPDVGIVALTGVDDQDAVREMLVAGASCYVLKDSDSDEIFHAIRQAAAGGGVISSEVTPRVIGELTEALERERRRARQLELAQEALLERAARRHELVSRLGHELRTPVTVILGMAQTLSKGTGSEEQKGEMLAALVMRAQGLARLVSRLEGVVEAGLTEYTDVTEVAKEVAMISPRIGIETPARPVLATHPRGAGGERARVLPRRGARRPSDRGCARRDRGPSDRPRTRHLGGGARADLRAARAGRGAAHEDPPRRRARPDGRSHVRPGDGRRRDPRVDRPGGLGVPLAGDDGRTDGGSGGGRYLNRRM